MRLVMDVTIADPDLFFRRVLGVSPSGCSYYVVESSMDLFFRSFCPTIRLIQPMCQPITEYGERVGVLRSTSARMFFEARDVAYKVDVPFRDVSSLSVVCAINELIKDFTSSKNIPLHDSHEIVTRNLCRWVVEGKIPFEVINLEFEEYA